MRGHKSPLFIDKVLVKSIVELLEEQTQKIIADQKDLFLVDVVSKGNGRGGKVIVLLDGDHGVGIDKCVDLSRKLSKFLDEDIDLIEPLTLEVSSAGLDHPLKLKRQYLKNVGKSVRVLRQDQSEVIGRLEKVEKESILIKTKGSKKKPAEEVKIEFKNINKTIVLVSFK